MSRKLLRICAACAVSLGSIGAAAAAAAPTLTLATASEPTESITTQLQASGASASDDTALSMTVKPTGGEGCGANSAADGGASVIGVKSFAEGPFSESANYTFTSAGAYLLCGWLNDDSQPAEPVVASASLTFTVRPPHLTLSISAPATVTTGQTFQLVTTAQAEVERTVTEYVLPSTGRGCPANGAAAGSTSGVMQVEWVHYTQGWTVDGGPFSESVNETLRSSGQYLVCAYMQYPSSESPPEATASATITAVTPPPPCVVPMLTATTKLNSIEQAIKAAGCAVGKIARTASRKIRSGYISGLSPSPGARLAGGTAVNITVSTGPPCVIPHIPAGVTLGLAEARLRAAHCAVGKIRAARSGRYRRGRVLSLGARPGQILPSHAPVEIVVSKGRRR